MSVSSVILDWLWTASPTANPSKLGSNSHIRVNLKKIVYKCPCLESPGWSHSHSGDNGCEMVSYRG